MAANKAPSKAALTSPDGALRRSATIPLAVVYADGTRHPRLYR